MSDFDARAGGTSRRPVDVAVIGDGPAGSALAAACTTLRLDTVLVGPDDAWTNTYATWIDDLSGVEDQHLLAARVVPAMEVHTERSIVVERAYGVLDNEVMRQRLREGVDHLTCRVTAVDPRPAAGSTRHVVSCSDGTRLEAAVVVDTTGWPAAFAKRLTAGPPPAWQTAMGVVLDEPPPGDLGRPTFMDFRPVGVRGTESTIGPAGVATFCYCLPVVDGWLVEETVLASRPSVEPIALLPRLAARLGRHPDALLADAVRTEYVRIPMGGRRPRPDQPVVAFGAAAGYVHPATGFSVAASLRAAPRVAAAIADAVAGAGAAGPVETGSIAEAVWPARMRRTRVLHDYGLEMMLKLEPAEVREFFGAFFSLEPELWPAYLRLDSSPGEVSRVMAELFRAVSWPMRRRLMAANPVTFAKLLRP
mgnify:FL=1